MRKAAGGAEAASVRDFLVSELFTFAIESVVNTFMASIWPFMWYSWMGTEALYWACGGYAIWAIFIAMALNRREERLRKELGLSTYVFGNRKTGLGGSSTGRFRHVMSGEP